MGVRRMATAALLLALALAATIGAAAPAADRAAPLVVFAAASLKGALDAVAADFERDTGTRVSISYAATSALAKQIENDAPADLFLAADRDWMDALAAQGLIRADTRHDLLGNELVLIAPRESTATLAIAHGFPLAAALDDGRLALADPVAVPAGRYAKAALDSLGVWSSVADALAPAENVRAALVFVARSEAPLGIVYRTDALAEPAVRVVGAFPPESHPPIVYPVAVVAASRHAQAAAFLAHLRAAAARATFERHGFAVLP